MKANHVFRIAARRPDQDAAVSTVLGAILVFGLLVVTLVMIQVKFVPVWDREREAGLMDTVSGQLATIKADADRQADNRTNVPVSDPLTLGRQGGFSFFTRVQLPGQVIYQPAAAGAGFNVASNQVHVLARNGRQIFAGSESWTQVNGDTVSSVGTVKNLRLRVSTPAAWDTGNSITLTVTDALGAYAGKFVLSDIDHGSSYTYQYDTYAASSINTPISTRQEDFQKQVPPTYHYLDLLGRDLLFADVLAAAKAPFTVAITRNVMQGDYTMTYDVVTAGGTTTQVGSGGILVPNYADGLRGGSLTFTSSNQRFPAQTYILEHGALIVKQPEGAAMRVPPQMRASVAGGVVDLRWTIPALSGTNSQVAGPTQATVTLQPASTRLDTVLTAPMMSFTVTTQYPAVWQQYWTTLLQGAGLTTAAGQFTITTTTTSATMTIYGLQTAPASTVDDLHVELKGALIDTAVQAVAGA